VGNSMVGGVIADIYEADDRGTGMNWFSLLNFMGQVRGPDTKMRPASHK
jgi:hypothetical protein